MAKEMIISSSAHEKKIAIIEDGVVTEYYVEREDESQGLAGSIYKGRVMKVLPGMQSAFVDIGLDRDAFLYVSDFLEEEGFDDIDSLEDNKQVKEYKEPIKTLPPVEPPVALLPQSTFSSKPIEASLEEEEEEEEMSIIPLGDEPSEQVLASFSQQEEPITNAIIETEEQLTDAEVDDFSTDDSYTPEDNTFIGSEPLEEVSKTSEPSTEPEPVVEAAYVPQVIIPPPSHDFIRISDDDVPEEVVEAIIETPAPETVSSSEDNSNTLVDPPAGTNVDAETNDHEVVAETTTEESTESTSEVTATAEPVEEEEPQTKKRRASRKEPAKKKPPALTTRRRGKKGVEAEAEPIAESTVEPAPAAVSYERIVDDELANAGELLKEAMIQHKIVEQLRREESRPYVERAGDIEKVEEPEVRVGSLQSHFQADPSLERIVDEEAANAALVAAQEASQPSNDPVNSEATSVENNTEDTKLSEDLANDGGEKEGNNWQKDKVNPRDSDHKPNYPRRNNNRRRRRGGPPQSRPPINATGEATAPAATTTERSERTEAPVKESAPPSISSNISSNISSGRNYQIGITELLREGQEIVVQIAKEPIALKGARITSHIALPGRYLVYMPTVHHIGVSRKIGSDAERLRLKRTMLTLRDREKPPGGFIVRTACEGHTEQELHEDMMYLVRTWQDIKKKAEKVKAPNLVASELDLVERTLRDQLSDDIVAIRVDSELEYTRIVDFVSRFQPKLVKKVKLYTWKKPIFEEYGVQEELDKALKPRVWLPSGGYIVINQTEALVAIDVNTGKYVGRSNRLEDTITKINMEAVKEIVRQIRLRDLGGIIVLDLIDMEERKNRAKVMQVLEQELKADRSPSKVLQFNDFGLVAITRKRVRQSLERTLCSPCPYCEGAGLVKSPQTVCYEILAEARRFANETDVQVASEVILRVNPEVANTLRNVEKKVFAEIEAYIGCSVTLRADASIHQERYDFAVL